MRLDGFLADNEGVLLDTTLALKHEKNEWTILA